MMLGLIILVVSFSSCRSPARDLDAICSIVEETMKDASITEKDKGDVIVTKIFKGPLTGKTRFLITTVDTSRAYEILKEYAREHGNESWECPALREYFSVQYEPVELPKNDE